MADTERGYLLMADISGYTAYLGASELEHARDTLAALLEVLVDGVRPPLVLSKLEGDAVFSYTDDRRLINSQTLMELIEAVYVAFRRAIDLMVLNNTCQCDACANVSNLDLKFVVHHGAYATQLIGGRQELVGSDVTTVHRLLKNTIAEQTGITAYAAYTAAAVESLGQEVTEGMVRVDETVADQGRITLWVQDMRPVWLAKMNAPVVGIADGEVVGRFETEIGLPVEVVWGYLADLEFRNILLGSDRQEVVDKQRGRTEEGSAYLCYHGNKMVKQVVLEWRPFERIVTRSRMDGALKDLQLLHVIELRATETGSVVTQILGGLTGPLLKRKVAGVMFRASGGQFERDGEAFREAVEADHVARQIEQTVGVSTAS
jgi:hypothetical protein